MRKFIFIFTILLGLTACGTDATQDIYTTEENEETEEITAPYETIDLEDIETYVDEGYIVADVREVEEFEAGHIPGAVNAPLSDLQEGELGPLQEDEAYVIICRSGNRSVTASDILSDLGFDIVNVSEGMSTWTGEVEK